MSKRMLSLAAVVAAAAIALPSAALAQAENYPDRPITFIVPYGPGGTVDPTARILGAAASEILGQPIVVENRAGAAGSVGADLAARADPDGYTVLIHTNIVASEPWLKTDLSYNFLEDMKPITAIDETPFVVLVHPSLPVDSVAELVEYAKANPGTLNFGASGVASSGHLRGEQFKVETDVDMQFIPYVDGGTTLAGLMSNEIQVAFDTLPGSIGMINDGRLKLLAVGSPERWFLVPDAPTMAESGFSGLASQWIGAYVPAATPQEIVDKLADAFQQALADPALQEQYQAIGFDTIGSSPEETLQRLTEETEMWRGTVEAANITIN